MMAMLMKSNAIPTGTYTLSNGAIVTIYNPRDCYLTWANGQIVRSDSGQIGRCTTKTEVKGDA